MRVPAESERHTARLKQYGRTTDVFELRGKVCPGFTGAEILSGVQVYRFACQGESIQGTHENAQIQIGRDEGIRMNKKLADIYFAKKKKGLVFLFGEFKKKLIADLIRELKTNKGGVEHIVHEVVNKNINEFVMGE